MLLRKLLCFMPSSLNKNMFAIEQWQRWQQQRNEVLSLLMKLLLCMPFDASLWGSATQWAIPYLRLTRIAITLPIILEAATRLERSQTLPFSVARVVRVIGKEVPDIPPHEPVPRA